MTLYVQLGKAGDILNILPMLAIKELDGEKPGLMVAEEYAGLLEGVSYVQPFVFKGHYSEVARACEEARTLAENWKCTQVNCSTDQVTKYVYGPANQKIAMTPSFQTESWKVAGMLKLWADQRPLLFNLRDQRREEKLSMHWTPGDKRKHILLSVGGTTSPFSYAQVIREYVHAKYQDKKKWNIVDLAEVQAERLYDLVGLYERAYCLIATDSAPLHLARAVPRLPVLAFTNDKPILWNGSPWRPNHFFYCRYSDFPYRVRGFAQALDDLPVWYLKRKSPIVHRVWSAYHEPTITVKHVANPWFFTAVTLGMCGRDTTNTIADGERHPFLKDCLSIGMQRADGTDYVCLTRPGTQFEENAADVILRHDACFAYRIERNNGRGTFHPIGDMFAAKKAWWRQRFDSIPPLVMAKDYFWSHVLAAMFRAAGAADVTGIAYREK